MQIPGTTSSKAYSSTKAWAVSPQSRARSSSFEASRFASREVRMRPPFRIVTRHEDRGRVAVRFGHEIELPAVPGVEDREEPPAVPHGMLVFGPLLGPDIAPVAFKVAKDESLRIFSGFDERDE